MEDLFIYVGAYLLGSIPTGKGKKGGAGLLSPRTLLDALKGAAAVTLARLVSPGDQPDWVFAGFLALAGEAFPIFAKFKGDRALGVTIGVFGALLFWMLTH